MTSLKNISNDRRYLRDLIILVLIVILPFLFFTYRLVPTDSAIWYSDILSLNLDGLKDLDYLIWIFYIKLLTLSILSLWFITCLNRWRYVLFFTIIVEIYKITLNIGLLKYGFDFDVEYSDSLIISIPYLLLLNFISNKIGFRMKELKSNIGINKEINKLSKFDAKQYKFVKNELNMLQSQKDMMDKKEYLTKLITLRDQLQ
ncbi:hypothetical protein [Psychroserpens damuponensis]|uniref:hypothetical protein n=1 Tax=Psychroserpens damuponensis TaxID=943936 RepID=UPI00058B5CC1|nr:hypothetical protein [Psychroserpens damuponensis]